MINTTAKDSYDEHVSLHAGSIAYDRKIYKEMGEYIKTNLWEHIDEKTVKAIFSAMTNAKNTHADKDIYINICKQHLPTIQVQLGVLKTFSFPDNYIDRLIKQQIQLFTTIDDTQLAISRMLVIGTPQELADDKKNRIVTITPLAKTIIANILTLLVMQEQEQTKPKIVPKTTIHMVRKKKKTVA